MVLNYTLEKHQWFLREEGREAGLIEGRVEGREEGKNVINKLNDKLLADNRIEDLKRSIRDKEYQDFLIKEYGLNDE